MSARPPHQSAVDLLLGATFEEWRHAAGADSALPWAPVRPEEAGRGRWRRTRPRRRPPRTGG